MGWLAKALAKAVAWAIEHPQTVQDAIRIGEAIIAAKQAKDQKS